MAKKKRRGKSLNDRISEVLGRGSETGEMDELDSLTGADVKRLLKQLKDHDGEVDGEELERDERLMKAAVLRDVQERAAARAARYFLSRGNTVEEVVRSATDHDGVRELASIGKYAGILGGLAFLGLGAATLLGLKEREDDGFEGGGVALTTYEDDY